MGIPRAVHAWALGSFAVLTLALVVLFFRYAGANVWDGLRESGELRKAHYSETVYIESIFRTRANTWSNLAFVLAGFYALAMAIRDRRTATGWLYAGTNTTPPALTILFGLACCYLGVGSGIFHASLTRWGQQLDVASMYPPMLALMAILARRDTVALFCLPEKKAAALSATLIAAVLCAAVLLYIYKWSMSSGKVLPLHVFTLAAFYAADRFLWRSRGRLRWLALSFLAVSAGTFCRQLDVAGNFSGPDAWYQGHAFWHVLCAASLGLGWYYIRDGETTCRPALGSHR